MAIGSLAIFAAFGDKVPHRILFFVSAAMAVLAWIVMIFFGTQMQAGAASQ